jgi:predicted porin
MNKKLIAVALAALPLAAMADVTLYGQLKVGIERDTQTNAASKTKVEDQTSIVGFKGTEDLGNGLKSFWQVENRINADGATGTSWGSRQTFVGIDGGNLGQVRIGFLNNFLNDQYSVDQWSYASGYNGLIGFTDSGSRVKNAVRYDSATFAGFSAGLEYGAGENATTTTASSDILGLGLNYTYGDVAAHYALQREKNPAANAAELAATKQLFEVDYKANNLFLSGAYQVATGYTWTDGFASATATSSQLKTRQAAVSVGYTIGAFTPKASYAKGWNEKANGSTVADSGYRQYVFGVDYALSKRTTAGLSYGNAQYGAGTAEAAGTKTTFKTLSFNLAHSF